MFLAGVGDGKSEAGKTMALADVEAALQEKALLYDKSGDEHYNLKTMKNFVYGRGYLFAHDHKDAVVLQGRLPNKLAGRRFYFPTDRGDERIIKNRLDRWRELKQRLRAEQEKES